MVCQPQLELNFFEEIQCLSNTLWERLLWIPVLSHKAGSPSATYCLACLMGGGRHTSFSFPWLAHSSSINPKALQDRILPKVLGPLTSPVPWSKALNEPLEWMMSLFMVRILSDDHFSTVHSLGQRPVSSQLLAFGGRITWCGNGLLHCLYL